MGPLAIPEAIAGGLLVFFVPGYAAAKAVFPERRVRGPEAVRWTLELVALAFVMSVVLTVVVGYVLLAAAPGGFQATWSDPLLESVLAAIALIAFVAGWLEGAYRRVPPLGRGVAPEPGSAGAWELARRLDQLQRDRQRLERELQGLPVPEGEPGGELRARLERTVREEEALRRRREADYDL